MTDSSGHDDDRDRDHRTNGARTARRTERCPVCEETVRIDRMPGHLRSVHPDQCDSAKVVRYLRARKDSISRAQRRELRTPRGWTRWGWTRWRIVGVILAVLIVGAAAYFIVNPPAPPGVRTGTEAPTFTFTSPSGVPTELSAYRGHPVVLWMVATWCSGCAAGTQVFAQSYYSQYSAAHVTLLEIEDYNDLGESGPGISSFASAYGYHGQSGWVLGVASASATGTYNPNSELDYYYVVSAGGVVVAQGSGLGGNFGAALSAATGG